MIGTLHGGIRRSACKAAYFVLGKLLKVLKVFTSLSILLENRQHYILVTKPRIIYVTN